MVPLVEKLPENFAMLIKHDLAKRVLGRFEYFLVDLGYTWGFGGLNFCGLFWIKSVKR